MLFLSVTMPLIVSVGRKMRC